MRLLKFDSFHPLSFLAAKQAADRNAIRGMNYQQYYDWLMGLKSNLSDYLTRPMNNSGWVAREVIGRDDVMIEKMVKSGEIRGVGSAFEMKNLGRHFVACPLAEVVRGRWLEGYKEKRRHLILRRYIETFRPDVIFIREPCHLDSRIFERYRDRVLIVGMIGCNTNHANHWSEHRHDMIFSFTHPYVEFFRAQGIESHLFEYGVDEQIIKEMGDLPKKYDCSFVGYLGSAHQSKKTAMMEAIASKCDFHWWGPAGGQLSGFPALQRAYQGETAGIDMLKIYRQSSIVVNDYVDTAQGLNVNLRTKEVLSVGSFLLTRYAENIADLEKEGALATFRDTEECVAKIRYFLGKQKEREEIARKGNKVARERFNYRDIASRLMERIQRAYDAKKSKLREWET